MTVVLAVEHRDGVVLDSYREAVSALAALAEDIVAVVVGVDAVALAAQINADGITEVIAVETPNSAHEPEVEAAAVADIARERQATLVVATSSATALGWAAAAAIRLGSGYAADIVAIAPHEDGVRATRGLYGGKVLAEVHLAHSSVALIRPAAFTPAGDAAAPTVVAVRRDYAARSQHRAYRQKEAGDVDITEADFVLAVGRGVGEQEALQTFAALADALGATLAVSRPLVDAGWISDSRQVGQSGKTVAPKIYLAFGISGAVQHVAGMKASGTVIAINTDPGAAIFGVADYGTTLDMFVLADELRDAWQS